LTDRGDNWTRLGGELTTGVDRNRAADFWEDAGQKHPARHDGVQEYPTITTLSESPLTPNVLVGWETDDGHVQVTRDGGKTWTNVGIKGPACQSGYFGEPVVASKTGEGAALLAVRRASRGGR